jgi:predicted MFS family arabinose efflux permease
VLSGFSAFLGLYATQPLLPLFSRVFHASNGAVSLTVTAPTMAVAAAAPLVGRLADICGRRRVIVAAAFVLAAIEALTATARGLDALIAWRFVQGIATPGVFAVALVYIHEEWGADGMGRATAAYVSGTVVGGFVGRAVSGIFATSGTWPASFAALAVLSVTCAASLWMWLPEERSRRRQVARRSAAGSFLSHLANRELLVTYAVGFCVLFTQVAMFTYVTFLLAAPPFGFTTAQLGWLFAVYLVGAIITPTSGRWLDIVGPRAMLGIAIAMGMTGALLTLAPSAAIVIAGLALCCSSVFIAQATASTHLGAAAAHDRGVAVGLYATFYYLGGSAGGALPALFWDRGGWPACVALVVVVQAATVSIGVLWRAGGGNVRIEEIEPVP